MHEMSLAEGILQIVEDHARSGAFQRVTAVVLEIGQLSGVEVEALRFAFDAVTRGSVAENATLQIIDVAGSGWCLGCSQAVPVTQLYDACPLCGAYQIQVTGGSDMRVKLPPTKSRRPICTAESMVPSAAMSSCGVSAYCAAAGNANERTKIRGRTVG